MYPFLIFLLEVSVYMSDSTLHRYRFLPGFCFDLVELELYCYPWLPCRKNRVRVALLSIKIKKS